MTAQQLKNSILQMAVQGKLVPQDPNDEPASVLLEKIRAEKEQMVKDGKIKKDNNPSIIFRGDDNLPYEKVGDNEPVCIADEVPFEIPQGWEIVRLHYVCQLTDGEKQSGITHPILDTNFLRNKGNFQYSDNGKFVQKGTKLILVDGENSGEVFTAPQDGYMGSTFKILWTSSEVYNPYLMFFIDLYRIPLKNSKRGAAIPHLDKKMFFSLCLPLPPLPEQRRIAVALNKIMPIVAQYDIDAATLTELERDFPDQLKKSILQQAVQGKLVPQDPADEPASILLEKIWAEKEQMIKDGKIKRGKHESVIYRRDDSFYEKIDGVERCIDDEIPFEIPESWEWTRLINIYNFIDYRGATPTKTTSGIRLITAKNVKKGFLDYSISEFITEKEYLNRQSRGVSHKGDILFTTEAPLGNVAIADLELYSAGQRLITMQQYTKETLLSNNFTMFFFLSNVFQEQLLAQCTGTTVKGIKAEKLKKLLIAVPPYIEQQNIVNKIEKVFHIIELSAV